jgi:hypothetical protein
MSESKEYNIIYHTKEIDVNKEIYYTTHTYNIGEIESLMPQVNRINNISQNIQGNKDLQSFSLHIEAEDIINLTQYNGILSSLPWFFIIHI